MCTLALYFRIFEDYPVVVAANRDEHYDRPSLAPHLLAGSPKIFAGTDLQAGGTWLGVNEYGVLAAILNRRANAAETPEAGDRSRGLLCLDLLHPKSAAACRVSLNTQEKFGYQPFSLVVADVNEAWVASNTGRKIETMPLIQGVHVFSSTAKHNEQSEKKQRAYSLFSSLVPALKSNLGDVSSWTSIFANVLSDHRAGNNGSDPKEAICVHTNVSGTVSSSIIIYSRSKRGIRAFFCAGAPCQNSFAESPTLKIE
jgi:uncharacterized protein with NRDE domain